MREEVALDDRLTVSVPEAVRMSGLGRSTLYEAMQVGSLEYVNVGRRRLVVVDSLRRFLLGDREAA